MFSDNLKAAREKMEITLEQFAYILHMDRSVVSKWERGRALPDADTLIRVAKVLGMKVSDLLGADVGVPEDDERYKEALTSYLAYLNIQIELENRRRRRIMIAIAVVAVLLLLILMMTCKFNPVRPGTNVTAAPMPMQ